MTPSALPSVTLVSGDFVPTGGMDMPNLALARFLAGQGRQVDVVAYRIAESLSSLGNVRFHRVPKPLRSYFLSSPLLALRGKEVGVRTLRSGGRAVVNGGNCELPDVNWVHYVHAAYDNAPAQPLRRAKQAVERRVALLAERRCLSRARLVIANSLRTKRDLVELVGIDPTCIEVVYYGVDERFRPAGEEERRRLRDRLSIGSGPVVVFVGALADRRKGFDTLFDAWQGLGNDWDATLLVIGRGAELPTWQERVERAGLTSTVKFLGFRSDVPDILRAADAIVAPTRYEAFGQAVQEALCCGVVPIVSADAGVTDRFGTDFAELLLRDPASSSELRTKLTNWRASLTEQREVASRLAARLSERSWDTMSSEIADLLERSSR
jgi:glycosyltransferase involved in cell wall biosynthesis